MIEASSAEEEERVWNEWWEALEVFRLYAEEPQAWTTLFHTGLKAALHPRERMALPGGVEELVWTGGDATEFRVGAADWTGGVYGAMDVPQLMEPFREIFGEGDDIIAICELFTFLVLSAARAEQWKGRLVLYITDNTNAEIWLRKRVAKNRTARYGLRLLQMLEARHGFHVTSAGVWTKHNQSMDLLPR